MRVVTVTAIAIFAVSAALASPAEAASPAAYSRPQVSTAALPNLGPAGNGRRKFVQFGCYLCHGSNGAGQFGPDIQGAEIGDLREAVTQGVPEWGMPGYGKNASAADITNLHAYLSSVGKAGEPKWWDWWLPHPTQ